MKYGIDVSTWQDDLDFERARILGYDFCICRIGYSCLASYSYGVHNLDDLFVHNINEAKAHGMELGVYYYSTATTTEEAEAEADWLLSTMDTYLDGVDLSAGIWLDVETEAQRNLGADELIAVVMAWVNRMNAAGKYVGIYGSYDMFMNGMNIDSLPNYVPLWVAQYSSRNDLQLDKPNANVKIWQYSESGNVDGVNVDENVMYE